MENQPEHWLDHEKERYPSQLVEDTKRLLKILVLFIPFPIYSALYMQQVYIDLDKFGWVLICYA